MLSFRLPLRTSSTTTVYTRAAGTHTIMCKRETLLEACQQGQQGPRGGEIFEFDVHHTLGEEGEGGAGGT